MKIHKVADNVWKFPDPINDGECFVLVNGDKRCVVKYTELHNMYGPICHKCCFREPKTKLELIGIHSCASLPYACNKGYYTLIEEILEDL